MGVWAEQVVPRVVEVALRTEDISRWRRRCIDGLAGVVVEPGFGTGLNVAHYPNEVTKIWAIDPSELSRRIAADRVASSPVAIESIGLDGESIPLADDSCDAALLTFALCTIPDHRAALAEMLRVVRPGGRLHFLEHGRSPDASMARWQDRLTPVQRRLADGCHLNRDIVADIAGAGFVIDWSEASSAGHPKPFTWFTVGVAHVPE